MREIRHPIIVNGFNTLAVQELIWERKRKFTSKLLILLTIIVKQCNINSFWKSHVVFQVRRKIHFELELDTTTKDYNKKKGSSVYFARSMEGKVTIKALEQLNSPSSPLIGETMEMTRNREKRIPDIFSSLLQTMPPIANHTH